MPKWSITGTSRSGQNVGTSGRSTDSVTVYDKADLDRRLDAASHDRDLDVTVREEN